MVVGYLSVGVGVGWLRGRGRERQRSDGYGICGRTRMVVSREFQDSRDRPEKREFPEPREHPELGERKQQQGEEGAVAEGEAQSLDRLVEVSEPLPWDTTLGLSFFDQQVKFARKRERILDKAYKECQRITAHYAKTFYLGTSFLAREKRFPVWAIYVWCRRTDDIVGKQNHQYPLGTHRIRQGLAPGRALLQAGSCSILIFVDGPRAPGNSEDLDLILEGWEKRLRATFLGTPRDALDLALLDVIQKYPMLRPQPFLDMIEGMRMDLVKFRYKTWDELRLYCYRVAATVGLMTLPIMGTSEPGPAAYERAQEPAIALGIALQITNILRDVGEDRQRGRIYLPEEDMERFGYTERELFDGVVNSNYIALMKFEIARAREYFAKAEKGIALLSPDARLPVRASMDIYSGILTQIEANDYDNFTRRAYVPKTQKLLMLPICWLRVQEDGPMQELKNLLGDP